MVVQQCTLLGYTVFGFYNNYMSCSCWKIQIQYIYIRVKYNHGVYRVCIDDSVSVLKSSSPGPFYSLQCHADKWESRMQIETIIIWYYISPLWLCPSVKHIQLTAMTLYIRNYNYTCSNFFAGISFLRLPLVRPIRVASQPGRECSCNPQHQVD